MNEQKSKSRFQVRLTPEGWVFVVILCFVTVSAILRNVNLLVVLSGMMIATLFLSWRCQVHILKSLFVRRAIPQHVHAGELVNIQWECRNTSLRMAIWNINIKDRLQRLAAPGSSELELSRREQKKLQRRRQSVAMICFPEVLAGQSMFTSYKTMFANRGAYQIGDADVSTSFPFALTKASRKHRLQNSIVVAPRLGTLSPSWDQRLQAIAAGNEAVKRRRGIQEDEFYALRRWRPGDNYRHIHWRTTAKYGRPMVKQFDQPSNRDLAMVVDLFAPTTQMTTALELSDFDSWLDACETALSFAATVFTKLGNHVQGQVAMGICGATTNILVDRYHGELVAQVMRSLAVARAGPESELGKTIVQMINSVSGGTPVYVVSPREMPTEFNRLGITALELARVRPLLRWLQVGSSEFESLFRSEAITETQKVNEIKQMWMGDVPS